ncbi:hypothetical protein PN462_08110 [Spirulina sp. CS-785/01]|uniref:hypothetical protein n=1 Tax=Spirulina sp. CS-785/01 TaxID=3021716 RepID=UPI00232DF1A2|nr:hypothetical protein [Spirulina sp. CS-785/01]MDB9313063.1 hypothetical protein [Spirulina sp. CS-785/01]
MAHWVKIQYERQEYIVDLDQVSAFACSPNGRVTFWLPDSSIPIILTRQGNGDDYDKVLNFVHSLKSSSLLGYWIHLCYDRSEYWVDLNRISSFCYTPNSKLTFWLPDASIPIILTKQGDPESYSKLRDFIIRKTGQKIP